MEEISLQNKVEAPEEPEDLFRDTRPLPLAERVRKQIARKRIFFLMLTLCVIVLGLIIWEVASMLA